MELNPVIAAGVGLLRAPAFVRDATADPGIDRAAARDEARRELAKPMYHRHDPSLIQRAYDKVMSWLGDLLERTGSAMGWWGALVIGLLLIGIIALVLYRTGRAGRRHAESGMFLTHAPPLTADGHRRRAAEFAGSGQWAEAVREQLRAIARDLEERAFIDPRPGRTATELAMDGGAAMPTARADLRLAADTFNRIWYGGDAAGRDDYDALVRVDNVIRHSRPGTIAAADRSPILAVPR
jgi:hypothetical protein